MSVRQLLLLHHGYRQATIDHATAALTNAASLGPFPHVEEIDTAQFGDDIDSGNWTRSHLYVWRSATRIQEIARSLTADRVVYIGGMPEVPHAIALGAYVEDFWTLESYDITSDGTSAWSSDEASLASQLLGVPSDLMHGPGPGILRIELSGVIDDSQVRRFVPYGTEIVDITLTTSTPRPQPGLVKSPADVAQLRRAVREAIAAIRRFRPNITSLHLIVSGPPSVAVAVGQELRLRSGLTVQTYRHRPGPSGAGELSQAILLTGTGPVIEPSPLTVAQTELALAQRQAIWMPAIDKVQRYAEDKAADHRRGRGSGLGRWYDGIILGEELRRFQPFIALPPVHEVVEGPAWLDSQPYDRGFGFERASKRWRLEDRLVVSLGESFRDPADAVTLARIFLFHEYLHVVHGITKPTASEVGKFANSLEHADYMCDLFGLLHELDLETAENALDRHDFTAIQKRLVQLIDLVIRSFWAFEDQPQRTRMEYRRLRRYMNWYWQLTRVANSGSLFQIAGVLARKPIVEIAGLESRAEGRRHYASLERLDPDAAYEMCIVLDSERLQRISSGPTASLMDLLAAFRTSNHGALSRLFTQLFEHIGPHQALPRLQ